MLLPLLLLPHPQRLAVLPSRETDLNRATTFFTFE